MQWMQDKSFFFAVVPLSQHGSYDYRHNNARKQYFAFEWYSFWLFKELE